MPQKEITERTNSNREINMKKFKSNKGLFDKKRFEEFEKEKIRWLKKLSMKRAIEIEEDLLSFESSLRKFHKKSISDNPVCYKILLKRKPK